MAEAMVGQRCPGYEVVVDFHLARKRLQDIARRYRGEEERPLGGYARAMATYAGAVVGGAGLLKVTGRPLPERIELYDLILLGAATHKTSRTLTKEAITSPLRAPFTQFKDAGGPGEVNEEVTAEGHSHAMGELLTCPFCMAQWVATGFVFSLIVAPRATRVAMTVMTARAISDALQLAYAAGEHRSTSRPDQ